MVESNLSCMEAFQPIMEEETEGRRKTADRIKLIMPGEELNG